MKKRPSQRGGMLKENHARYDTLGLRFGRDVGNGGVMACCHFGNVPMQNDIEQCGTAAAASESLRQTMQITNRICIPMNNLTLHVAEKQQTSPEHCWGRWSLQTMIARDPADRLEKLLL